MHMEEEQDAANGLLALAGGDGEKDKEEEEPIVLSSDSDSDSDSDSEIESDDDEVISPFAGIAERVHARDRARIRVGDE